MNIATVQKVVDEIGHKYSDNRLNLFLVEVSELEDNRCLLSGAVLDAQALDYTLQVLRTRFPDQSFDTTNVQVLRREPAQNLAVSTNLAGLHRHPSRSTEMVTQVLNGIVVEHLRDEGPWTLVRQQDGYLGWMLRAYATTELDWPEPTHMVAAPVAIMFAEPKAEDAIVSRLFAATKVHVAAQEGDWAQIEMVGGLSGWVPARSLRTVNQLPQTAVAQRKSMVEAARAYIGVPYEWGGCTISGIDCSGLAQLMHRLCGIELPRDADMQCAAGTPVEPPFQPGDLLYFGSKESKRSITHVAMSIGGWKIIHSSGSRNGVYQDDVQQVPGLQDSFVGANTFLK